MQQQGAKTGFPLKIQVFVQEEHETPFNKGNLHTKTRILAYLWRTNQDFILATLRKINWAAFRGCGVSLHISLMLSEINTFSWVQVSLGVSDLPELLTDLDKCDDSLLRSFHYALLDLHVKEGYLICPDTGRRFPITWVYVRVQLRFQLIFKNICQEGDTKYALEWRWGVLKIRVMSSFLNCGKVRALLIRTSISISIQ